MKFFPAHFFKARTGRLISFLEKCFAIYYLEKEDLKIVTIEESLIEGIIDFKSREDLSIKIRVKEGKEWYSIFIAHTMEDFYHFAGSVSENLTRSLTNNNSFRDFIPLLLDKAAQVFTDFEDLRNAFENLDTFLIIPYEDSSKAIVKHFIIQNKKVLQYLITLMGNLQLIQVKKLKKGEQPLKDSPNSRLCNAINEAIGRYKPACRF